MCARVENSVFAIHHMVSWLYLLAFCMTLTGLTIYHRPEVQPLSKDPEAADTNGMMVDSTEPSTSLIHADYSAHQSHQQYQQREEH